MLAHNVAELLKSPAGTTRFRVIDDPEPDFGPDLQVANPVRGSVRLLRTQNAIIAYCQVRATVQLDCSRCLEPFLTDLTATFAEEFLPSINVVTGAALQSQEDTALRIDERHILDLTEITRQYLLMALPLNPICAATCLGLCPGCGVNLNSGQCSCAPEVPATPLGILASLLANED
jgi:uncharacterized protein